MSMPCSAPASFPPGRRRSSGRMVMIAAASSSAVGHPLAVGDAPLHRRPADVPQTLIGRRLGKETLEPERRGQRLVGIGARLALQRRIARADPEEPAENGDDAEGDRDSEIERAPGARARRGQHDLGTRHCCPPSWGAGGYSGKSVPLPVECSRTQSRPDADRRESLSPLDGGGASRGYSCARLGWRVHGFPGVEWSRLATRPGGPVPGHRILLSSGDALDAMSASTWST